MDKGRGREYTVRSRLAYGSIACERQDNTNGWRRRLCFGAWEDYGFLWLVRVSGLALALVAVIAFFGFCLVFSFLLRRALDVALAWPGFLVWSGVVLLVNIPANAFAGLLEFLLFHFYIDEVLKDGNLTLYVIPYSYDFWFLNTCSIPVVGGA